MPIQSIADHLETGRLTLTIMDDGSGVLLDTEREALFSLNATGLVLIQQIRAGAKNIEDIAAVVAERFQVGPEQARRDAVRFLTDINATL